jgi:hypothetical protein
MASAQKSSQKTLMKVDWNPNIVTHLHPLDRIETNLRRVMLHTADAVGVIKMAEEFTRTYQRAREMAGKRALLAYRLDLAAQPAPKELNLMAPMQLGGLPDLVDSINGSAMHAIHQGIKPDLKALVNRYWPNNQITGQPLKFLCQLDLFQWMAVIHFLTFESWAEKDEARSNEDYYWFSGAGGRRMFEWPHRLQVWFDPDFRESYFGANAFMLVEGGPLWEKDAFAREEVVAAIAEKNREAEAVNYVCQQTLPRLQLLTPKLGFDIEQPENGRNPISDRLRDQLDSDPLFCGDAEITVFGRASSQQEPVRFLNPYPNHPHRLTPFLCWGSQEHDITYQIYAALKTFQNQWVECKVDSSCT